jgi:hypothetical protein
MIVVSWELAGKELPVKWGTADNAVSNENSAVKNLASLFNTLEPIFSVVLYLHLTSLIKN